MLEDGDLENAQQLAHLSARAHGLELPDPATLADLNTGVDYRFAGVSGAEGGPTLELVKAWRDGNQDHEARLTLGRYGMSEELAVDLRELDALRQAQGLKSAMTLAESMAVAGGYLDPDRDDPRLFSDGPPDPFTTERQRQLNIPSYEVGAISANGESVLEVVKSWGEGAYQRLVIPQPNWQEAQRQATIAYRLQASGDLQGAMNQVEQAGIAAGTLDPDRDDPRLFTEGPPDPFTTHLERQRAEPFGARFTGLTHRLLEPLDAAVNYSFEVQAADPWTLELAAAKWWIGDDGRVDHQSQTLKTYSMESYAWERETEREIAAMDREDLERTHLESGLQAAMHQAEALAVANQVLEADRADGRLFQLGPPDRFSTLREMALAGLQAAPEREGWDALIVAQADENPDLERHYWQMHYRPVETPDGKSLGTALFVTEFPQLPADFDAHVADYGMDDSIYPTEARTLEMAHFATRQDAEAFDKEFRSYLVPEVLDGPDLAPEVARLEGLRGAWQPMDYRGIVDYMSGNRTVVREADDWHLHNPDAEREAQAQFESPGTDMVL
jgi:hypothetical protein